MLNLLLFNFSVCTRLNFFWSSNHRMPVYMKRVAQKMWTCWMATSWAWKEIIYQLDGDDTLSPWISEPCQPTALEMCINRCSVDMLMPNLIPSCMKQIVQSCHDVLCSCLSLEPKATLVFSGCSWWSSHSDIIGIEILDDVFHCFNVSIIWILQLSLV